jgi:hypothetical protein
VSLQALKKPLSIKAAAKAERRAFVGADERAAWRSLERAFDVVVMGSPVVRTPSYERTPLPVTT